MRFCSMFGLCKYCRVVTGNSVRLRPRARCGALEKILILKGQAMLEMFSTTQFWVDVFKIIMIDLLLSADNAVVIALACRNLPEAQRRKGILLGVGGAIGLTPTHSNSNAPTSFR